MTAGMEKIHSLQLGMHWFPERAGGLDRVFCELSRALPSVGVSVAGLVAGSCRVAADSSGTVRAFAPISASLLRRFNGMRQSFLQAEHTKRPDIIVSHFALYTLPVLDVLKQPLAIHFQGPWANESGVEGNAGPLRALKWGIERLVYRRASRAIVLSNAFADILCRNYKFPESNIHVIPGGIDSRRFECLDTPDIARQRLEWPLEKPVIFVVRRLVRRMGLESLIAAIAILKTEIPEILVMIAGHGPLHPRLAAQIASQGLSRNIRLLGFVPDDVLPSMYRAADLSVVPSIALEGFGLVAAESLAAGTPCLVSPVGGLPEVVSALSKNLILASIAPTDIARGISDALSGQLVMPSEESCRAYATANFDWSVIANRVADVYRMALM
jgi:glycosyltransferase involved in cell wall biosynthesis